MLDIYSNSQVILASVCFAAKNHHFPMFASEIVSKPPQNPKRINSKSHFLMVKIYMKICKTNIKNDHKSSTLW